MRAVRSLRPRGRRTRAPGRACRSATGQEYASPGRLTVNSARTYPMISTRPSTTAASSSSEARPSRRPMRSTESVRTWLILTHERLGRLGAASGNARGNPARGSRLARAAAMTAPDRSLDDIVAENNDRALAGFFVTARGVQVRPADVAPPYTYRCPGLQAGGARPRGSAGAIRRHGRSRGSCRRVLAWRPVRGQESAPENGGDSWRVGWAASGAVRRRMAGQARISWLRRSGW